MKLQNILLAVTALLLILTNIQNCQSKIKTATSFDAVLDTLRQLKVKTIYGDSVYQAQISVIELSRKHLEIYSQQLGARDSSIRLLLAMSSKNAVSATYYNSTTNVIGKTDTVVVTDTLFDGKPTYTSTILDKWYTAFIVATADSTKLSLFLENPFHVEYGYKKDKGLKKKLTVTVTPLNPYSAVVDMRSFTVPRPKFQAGVGGDVRVLNKAIFVGAFGDFTYKKITFTGTAGYSTLGPYYGAGVKYNLF